jgi:hypothetical protein
VHAYPGQLVQAFGRELLLTPDEDRGCDLVTVVQDLLEGGLRNRWVVLAIDDRYVSDAGLLGPREG